MMPSSLVTSATKAARYVARRRRTNDDRYELDDMIQDGCVALLQGRSAYYGIVDGLRSWLGRYGRLTIVPIDEARDAAYFPDPLRTLIAKERLERYTAKLDVLRPKQRCAYMLQQHEGKSVKQICQVIGLTQPRVNVLIRQAKDRLGRVQ